MMLKEKSKVLQNTKSRLLLKKRKIQADHLPQNQSLQNLFLQGQYLQDQISPDPDLRRLGQDNLIL